MLTLIHSFFNISFKYFFTISCSFDLIDISNDDFISFVFSVILWFTSFRLDDNFSSKIVLNTSFKFSTYFGISSSSTLNFIFSFDTIMSVFWIQFIFINMFLFMSITHVIILLICSSILIHLVIVLSNCTLSLVTIWTQFTYIDLMLNLFSCVYFSLITVVHVSVSISLFLSIVCL